MTTPSPAPISASQASQASQAGAANGEALPAFPSRATWPDSFTDAGKTRCLLLYTDALAAAWEARCRLAVVALRHIQAEPRTSSKDRIVLAQEALYDIGPLPSPKEQRT